jgi:hypothetical protein
MSQFLYTVLVIFGFFAIAFAMINIRYIFTGKEFRGTCASNNPMIKNKVGECTVCGKKPEEDCKMPAVEGK